MRAIDLNQVSKKYTKTQLYLENLASVTSKKVGSLYVIVVLIMLLAIGYSVSTYKKVKYDPKPTIINPVKPMQQSNSPEDATQDCLQAIQDYTNSGGTKPIPTCL